MQKINPIHLTKQEWILIQLILQPWKTMYFCMNNQPVGCLLSDR